MRVTPSDSGISDRLDFKIDHDADPVDIGAALAEFLLAYVRDQEERD